MKQPAPSKQGAKPKAKSPPAKAADQQGIREYSVGPDDDGIRLDRWFKRHLPDTSFNIVSRWARTGQIRVDGKRAAPGDRIMAGQKLRVPPADADAVAARPVRARKRTELTDDMIDFAQSMVIYRDKDALVLNKPPGLATQGGTKTSEHVDGLLDALYFDSDQRPKLVHRLDKDTSGVLLVARSSRSAAHFSKAFSSRTARKVYWALVMGVPSVEDGVIELPLGKQPGSGGEKMCVDHENGQPSKSRYRIIEQAGNRCCWVELQPFTGRTHQLRVHMAAIGHPIVGDGKYGGKEAFLTGAISRKMHLHARRIRIDHPAMNSASGEALDVTANLPPHMAHSLEDLGFDLALGDALPLATPKYKNTLEAKIRLKKNIAKEMRKERKGERRARGEVKAAGKTGVKGKAARGKSGKSKSAGPVKHIAPKQSRTAGQARKRK
ncbi:RluA family pseudouridine synthase [Sphingorhabdus arenilitoris]|uniref:Ribosomal large subunit pseudouridine synthase D n=1 Tax=Sphingorhabdus arenilitoris TaxID=1490041 RepID=A0ABV8RDS4_9SPHN